MTEPRNCPFCDEAATARRVGNYYEVECDCCDATVAGENEADAIQKWNHRAPDPRLKEACEAYKKDDGIECNLSLQNVLKTVRDIVGGA